jgi:hypothetical protein
MPGGTFSIRVVDDDGGPVEGASVSCKYGAISGVGSELTDSDGWAQFDIIEGAIDTNVMPITTIWINDVAVSDSDIYPDDGDTMSFTLPSDEDD